MKIRIDELLVNKSLAKTRSQAKLLIKGNKVLVNEKKVTKPGLLFDDDSEITLTTEESYVGRGAFKIKAAIRDFKIDPTDKVIADIGASTGGFTDYLLQNGAIKSYAIDVGHDQLAEELLNDERVINMEKTNIRDDVKLPELVDLAVVDLSFISLKKVLKQIVSLVKKGGDVICLFKPQFEAGKENIGKGGIVKERIREKTYNDFQSWCKESGYNIINRRPSPIKGKDGNGEYLIHIKL